MTLRIPIGTQCGTVQSGRGRYVNHVVIQANPVIMQVKKENRITYFKCNTVLLCVSLGSLDGQCCWSILGKCNNNVGMIGKWSGKQSMEVVGSVLATKPTPAKSNWQIINQPLPWLPVWLVTTGSAKKTGTARNIHIGRHPNLRIALSVHWSSVKSYLHVHQVWPLLIEIPKSVRV